MNILTVSLSMSSYTLRQHMWWVGKPSCISLSQCANPWPFSLRLSQTKMIIPKWMQTGTPFIERRVSPGGFEHITERYWEVIIPCHSTDCVFLDGFERGSGGNKTKVSSGEKHTSLISSSQNEMSSSHDLNDWWYNSGQHPSTISKRCS